MLKELVWKEINKEKELANLKERWRPYGVLEYFIDNVEYIAKEKQEILNKPTEYTQQDILDMFVEAGFEWDEYNRLSYNFNKFEITIYINDEISFWFNFKNSFTRMDSILIMFNDRKRIEFYYNIFRNILEFETNKENK